MPTITADKISTIAREVLHAVGASEGHARIVGTHLANANLAGHDSHGFIRIIQYVSNIRQGDIDPKAEPEVERDVGAMAQVNGNSTFGQVVAMMASDLAMDKAREHGIGLVAMHNLGHTGRVGTYPERIANEGMAAMMWTGFVGGTAANSVAPFGGRARRLGTNPVSMSFPSPTEGPVLLDFATSVAAEGKLRVYRARGHTLPSEWVLNKEGVPSRDPNDYYEGGALLPMGGLDGGHKGYGLSIMVALFGAVLGSLGHQSTTMDTQKNGSSIVAIDLSRLASIDHVRELVGNIVAYVKDTPAMEGSGGVLYPGEIEAMTRKERLAEGVSIEQSTWDEVVGLVQELGVESKVGPLPE